MLEIDRLIREGDLKCRLLLPASAGSGEKNIENADGYTGHIVYKTEEGQFDIQIINHKENEPATVTVAFYAQHTDTPAVEPDISIPVGDRYTIDCYGNILVLEHMHSSRIPNFFSI